MKKYFFFFFFFAVWDLCCWEWADCSSCGQQGLRSSCGMQASHRGGFSCYGARALESTGPVVAALNHVESSCNRDRTWVPCIGRQILYHWTTREVLMKKFCKWKNTHKSILRTSEKQTSQLKHRMKLQTTVIRKSTLWLGGFPDNSSGKESTYNAGDTGHAGLIPGSEGSPGGGNCNPLQYSCLKNPKEPGWLQSKGSKRAGHNWVAEHSIHTLWLENDVF